MPPEPSAATPPPPSTEPTGFDTTSYGGESETERAVKRIVPWVLSLGVHGGLLALGFLITWTVVILQEDDEPTLITADFEALTYEPLVEMSRDQAEVTEQMAQDRAETEMTELSVEDQLTMETDPIALFSDASSEQLMARFAPDPSRETATFVGLSTTNARRIVYVIDASGSMIRSLRIVLEELARSLDGLSSRQEFSVIFFQSNEALSVPPTNRLIPATESEKLRVLAWIDENVIPAGRSNPLAAIEQALRFNPDVIFLLSENITGSGEFEIDQADLLALLDQLNPADPGTGLRPTQINCIQFLDPDPLDTLRKIALAHGGERGYKFLDRAELGLKRP